MAKFKRWILKNWLIFAIGCVLMKLSIDCAYIERGYKAYGGEWLVLPMFLVLVWFAKDVIRKVRWKGRG